MAVTPKSAGIYCRLSYAPDGSVEKVERQEADCRQLAARLGWTVSDAHVFPDNSRSAWQRNRKRPQWDRMLRAVEAGELDGIIVYHGDRLIRQPYDLETLIGIAESKGLRIASPSGTRDLDSPDDRFILRIEAAQACRESDNTSRRVKRGVKARTAKGLPGTVGGKRPYGWGIQTGVRTKTDPATGEQITVPTFDTTKEVRAEIEFIKGGVERLLAGMEQGAVVRWLNSEGARTTEGNGWTGRSWRRVMVRPRIAGLVEHEGQLHEAAWAGAISVEEWEAVKALYQASSEKHPYQGRERKYLLTGVAECFQCHKPSDQNNGAAPSRCDDIECTRPHRTAVCKPTGGRSEARHYYCPSCRGVNRNVTFLDAYVEGRVLRLLSSKRFRQELDRAVRQEGGADLRTQIAALERRRDKTRQDLKALADNPDVDATLALLALSSFDRKIAGLRAQMATSVKLRRLTRMAGIGREEWAAETVDVRATVVSDLFRVVILPTSRRGPGFDPSSVRLTRHSLEGPADNGDQAPGCGPG